MYTPNCKMTVARDDLGRAAWKRGIEDQVTTIRHFGIRCILEDWNLYFLFRSLQCQTRHSNWLIGLSLFRSPAAIPRLNEAMKEICEGQLTYSECFKVLSTFENNKTPGNDGLSIEFYKFFWPEFGTFPVDSLNYAYIHGELSNSQKEAVITLIEK